MRVPRDGVDLARHFLANGDSAADLKLFAFRALPVRMTENRAFRCCGADWWDARAATEEKPLRAMGQKGDPGVRFSERCEIGEFSARGRREFASRGGRRVGSQHPEDRANGAESGGGADVDEPAGDGRVCDVGERGGNERRVVDLATQLTRAVCETRYDMHRMSLPSMTLVREARKHVTYVVGALLPASEETVRVAVRTRRGSRWTEVSSLVESLAESPLSVREGTMTPETSLLGTPSSLSVVLGHESKRLKTLPALPAKPPFG